MQWWLFFQALMCTLTYFGLMPMIHIFSVTSHDMVITKWLLYVYVKRCSRRKYKQRVSYFCTIIRHSLVQRWPTFCVNAPGASSRSVAGVQATLGFFVSSYIKWMFANNTYHLCVRTLCNQQREKSMQKWQLLLCFNGILWCDNISTFKLSALRIWYINLNYWLLLGQK